MIAWGDIRDFYLELPPEGINSDEPRIFIEHSGGKQMLPLKLSNQTALLERIETKALCSLTRKFEFRETRDLVDTPQIFSYDNPRISLIILRAAGIWLLAVVGLLLHSLVSHGLNKTISNITIEKSALLLFIAAFEPIRLLITIPRTMLEQKFMGQQIMVSKINIIWRDGANKIEIPWGEIRTYYFESVGNNIMEPLCIVESARDRISFFSTIQKSLVLQLIIKQNAKNADVPSWRYSEGCDAENLGLPTKPNKGGKQTFHYRTRTNRSILIVVVIGYLGFVFGSYFYNLNSKEPTTLINQIMDAGMFGLPIMYGILAYLYWRIEIDRKGISYITLFNRTSIPWDEIQALKNDGFLTIKGKRKTIRINTGVSQPEYFQESIAKRSNRSWEKISSMKLQR